VTSGQIYLYKMILQFPIFHDLSRQKNYSMADYVYFCDQQGVYLMNEMK